MREQRVINVFILNYLSIIVEFQTTAKQTTAQGLQKFYNNEDDIPDNKEITAKEVVS